MDPLYHYTANNHTDPSLYQQIINVDDAWEQGLTGNGVTIAVIGSGFWTYSSEATTTLNWAVDGGSVIDQTGHETKAINIITGQHNGKLNAGIAPGADVISIKATRGTNTHYYQSDLVKAIDYAVLHGADIINLSIQGLNNPGLSLTNSVTEAINAGVEVVSITGNKYDEPIGFLPTIDGVHGVGSVTRTIERVPESQTGEYLDLYAPGDGLRLVGLNDLAWGGQHGTSFAAPQVAAAMALLIEAGVSVDRLYETSLPVLNETAGVINIGFAIHTGSNPLLHINQDNYSTEQELGVSYLIPEQAEVFDVKLWIDHGDTTWYLNEVGGLMEYESTAFQDLPANLEFVGNVWGHAGIYPLMDLTGVESGEYVFNVELIDQSGQLIQVIGQEIVII